MNAINPVDERAALSTIAHVIDGLVDQVRDAKGLIRLRGQLLEVSATRVEHVEIRLGNAVAELRAAQFAAESLAALLSDKPLIPPPLRTFMRGNDEPVLEVVALSYADIGGKGGISYVVRNPNGGWDLSRTPFPDPIPIAGASWDVVTRHIHVTMTEVRR